MAPRVLVVDDEPDFVFLIKTVLKSKLSAEVTAAEDCASARKALACSTFDLITMGYELPDGNGIDLMEEIVSGAGHAPVVIVTGKGDEQTAARACTVGASGYVIKDEKLETTLVSVVQNALERATVRKKEEAVLKESESWYRSLYESSIDGIASTDMEGNITGANRAYLDMLGYSLDEVKDLTYIQLTPEKWHAIEQAIVDTQITERGYSDFYEKEYVRKGGSVFPVSIRTWLIEDERGNPVGMWAFVRDITERKRAREALREASEELQAILDNMGDGVLLLDMEAGTILSANPAMASMLGYSQQELVGMAITDIHPAKELECIDKEMARGVRDGTRLRDLICKRKDGSVLIADMTGSTPISYRGRSCGVGVFKDITEQIKMEETLRLSQQTLQIIFDSMPGFVFFKDRDNRLVRANRTLCEAMGMTEAEIIGRPLSEIFPYQSEEYWRDDLEVLESGEPKLGIREPIETAGGRRWLQTDKVPYKDPGGEIIGIIGFSMDITERKRAEDDLQKANIELDGFAHTVSHDLRSPLSAIFMASEILPALLSKASPSDEVQSQLAKLLSIISKNVRKSGNLIEDLLALAGAGQVPQKISTVEIAEIVENVLEENSERIEAEGISVEVVGDPGRILADPTHMYQLFSNLINNAIEHNDSGSPEITISRLEGDGGAGHRYLVKDNGSGIPPDELDKLFIPFFKGKSGNTGIGLSIVEKIVKVYDGEIAAYNDAGACFEFRLMDFCQE